MTIDEWKPVVGWETDRPTPLTDALVLPIQGWTDLYDAAEAYNKLLNHARQLERQNAELREALEHILWIKDCGIDGTNEKGEFVNWSAQERDEMYKVSKDALARKQP